MILFVELRVNVIDTSVFKASLIYYVGTLNNNLLQFKMSVNFNQVSVDSQCDSSDIEQFSTKTIENYSIVSRKQLERIVHSSERCLVNNIHYYKQEMIQYLHRDLPTIFKK